MSSTVYIPTFLSPKNVTRDMNINQEFSATVNGVQITGYRIKIFRIADNVMIYDSTKITLGNTLYDNETLAHVIPPQSVQNGLDLKWTLEVFNGLESVISTETFFQSRTQPVVSLSLPPIVNSTEYQFTATYSQLENVPIKKFKFVWADIDENIIEDSGWIFSGNIRFTFYGFDNNKIYKVKCIIENQVGTIVDSGYENFEVSYEQPSLIVKPDVKMLTDKSAVNVSWSQAKQIEGMVVGTHSYINNFLFPDNKGIKLDEGSNLQFDLLIPEDSTLMFVTQFAQDFTGVFCKLDEDYQIGYENGKFYFDNRGAIEDVLEIPINGNQFLVCVRPMNVYVVPLNLVNVWSDYSENKWADLVGKTWDDLKFISQGGSSE